MAAKKLCLTTLYQPKLEEICRLGICKKNDGGSSTRKFQLTNESVLCRLKAGSVAQNEVNDFTEVRIKKPPEIIGAA